MVVLVRMTCIEVSLLYNWVIEVEVFQKRNIVVMKFILQLLSKFVKVGNSLVIKHIVFDCVLY